MKNLLGALASAALTIAAYVWAPYFMVATIPVFGFFMVRGLREQAKENGTLAEELEETDTRLRRELLATHLSLIAVEGADNTLKTRILELLIEAGKHLGQPVVNSRVVYGLDFFVRWNQEGIDLVEQAKALLPVKPEVKLTVTSMSNESPGILYEAIREKDENAIHAALKGVSEAIGFVFWHSHPNPTLDTGWTKDFADNCKAMGFELRLSTIENPDLTGHMDELYKTFAYISY
jgi:hypothetical protein